jgi:hypothetical protein
MAWRCYRLHRNQITTNGAIERSPLISCGPAGLARFAVTEERGGIGASPHYESHGSVGLEVVHFNHYHSDVLTWSSKGPATEYLYLRGVGMDVPPFPALHSTMHESILGPHTDLFSAKVRILVLLHFVFCFEYCPGHSFI